MSTAAYSARGMRNARVNLALRITALQVVTPHSPPSLKSVVRNSGERLGETFQGLIDCISL